MPRLTVDSVAPERAEADLLAVGAFAGEDGAVEPAPAAARVGEALGIDLAAELVAAGFDAAPDAVLRVPARGALSSPTVLVCGLGPREQVDADRVRRAAAAASQAAERVETLASALPTETELELGAQAAAEGHVLGAYRYVDFRTEDDPRRLATVALLGEGLDAARERGEAAADAALWARDLVNTPPQAKRPPALAQRVADALADTDVQVRVLDEGELAAGGYGGLLGVGQGSSEPPRLVELTYDPGQAGRHVALVGKGITFDTGGISLKPAASMETMKLDMAGAAAVAATVRAAAAMRLPVKVTGLLALAENMPSGSATRVSDVLTIRGGTTVEVVNTDAEGRLVLADALVHASELEPDAIVDLATLTGAVTIALGDRIGGLMGDDDTLADALLSAAEASGEPMWRLPLATEQYGEELKGDVADLKNAGWKGAGTVRAALFLHEFVGESIPWAHLDIAGVAWTDAARGYLTKGGTGVPVRTLLHWLEQA